VPFFSLPSLLSPEVSSACADSEWGDCFVGVCVQVFGSQD